MARGACFGKWYRGNGGRNRANIREDTIIGGVGIGCFIGLRFPRKRKHDPPPGVVPRRSALAKIAPAARPYLDRLVGRPRPFCSLQAEHLRVNSEHRLR